MSTVSQVVNSALSQVGTTSPITLPTTSALASSSSSSSSSTTNSTTNVGMQSLAGNFDTFLQLLTTQLQNQDPLDPLDTNQFTQQLVEFASVEQQVDMNTNMQTLIGLQQTSEATSAMQFLGSTVTVNGNTATLSNATGTSATWSISSPSPATGTVTITNSSGQTAYTGTVSLSTGTQTFAWNGQGNNGATWPDGTYTMSVTAVGATGQSVAVSTLVQGTVTGLNLSQNPPEVTVGGQNYKISQIEAINK